MIYVLKKQVVCLFVFIFIRDLSLAGVFSALIYCLWAGTVRILSSRTAASRFQGENVSVFTPKRVNSPPYSDTVLLIIRVQRKTRAWEASFTTTHIFTRPFSEAG